MDVTQVTGQVGEGHHEHHHLLHRHDEADLASFGYKQELKRSLGFFSSFAAAFSYISPSTGIFTLFALGLVTIGGVFIWTWPIVALGQFIIALNFAEISSHFPVAGSVFQWTKYLAGKRYAWFSGWIYLIAGILTTTAVLVTFPLAFLPAMNELGWNINAASLSDQRWVALVLLVVILVLNIYSVRLVSLINNTGVLFEILGMVVFAIILMALHHHHGISVVTQTGSSKATFGSFFAAMFMSLFVIYGFDTASTLAEETNDPRSKAPRAVLTSVVGAFVIGGIFLLALLVAVPGSLASAQKAGFGPAQIIEANFSKPLAVTYLLVVSAAILVCCMVIMAATIRLCFGMARDDNLPFSRALAKVNPNLHTPVVACVVVGVLAAVPMIKYAGAGIIAIAATAMIYLTYLLGNFASMRARLKGWPRVRAPFRLGRFGPIVNGLGIAYGVAMLVDFAWPRAASNPSPNQTLGALSLGVGWLNKIPILYTVLVVVLIVGALYYALGQSRKDLPPVVVPPESGPVEPAGSGVVVPGLAGTEADATVPGPLA
ncbi:MAG: APC family permease [Actinomycetota bacterium]|nr:APC family permease [Actinomycetota bacterium]